MRQIESFFWGIIAALGALIVEYAIFLAIATYKNPLGEMDVTTFLSTPVFIVLAVLIEEIFKYLIIAKRVDRISLEKTFIINALFVGLGFFLIEFIFIYFKNSQISLSLIPILQVLLIHMTTAGIIGYRIALGNPNKLKTIVPTILIVTILHSAYNLTLASNSWFSNYLIYSLLGLLVLKTIYNISSISRKLAS